MRLVLGTGFAAILERHLEAASPADLIVWALAGLTDIDPSLSLRRSGRDVTLAVSGRALLTRTAPAMNGPDGPARAGGAAADDLTRFQEAAWAQSQLLRRAGAPRLIAESFEGIFAHLDPFSRYITPEEAQAARERRTGEAGLGLRLAPGRGAGAVIAAVSSSGPAARAGLRIGDRVLAIDGQALRTRDPGVAAGLLEGPAGSEVQLLVQQGRTRKEVRLVRTLPMGSPVTSERRDDILVIRIPTFSAQTDRQVAAALLGAIAQGRPRGVVLDLRGNRGGLLSQAAAVADIFLGEGEAFRTIGRHPDASRIYVTTGPDITDGLPVVTLVDGRTASSAEILAAALGDRGRAAVAGTVTMGKGTVQVVIPLPDGGELLISWSRLVMPAGWPLQLVGVIPGLCTAGGPERTAVNLAALQAGARPMGPVQAAERALRLPVREAEAERLRAACPPGDATESELAAARALAADPFAIVAALPR
ncbi:PDZ domain-containing protein [Roseomonas sp. JC162]|uniref:PDZ domain-containing protein n=1 Tax=Neoroseomonas marina TaxID=1232220 RepID=A0A848E8U6_9PROT|nr:S41 family peptidase [Neoroseomonas marina]NMJ39635.1 PDZ domain-containing protein [Neoroseomonas marina]